MPQTLTPDLQPHPCECGCGATIDPLRDAIASVRRHHGGYTDVQRVLDALEQKLAAEAPPAPLPTPVAELTPELIAHFSAASTGHIKALRAAAEAQFAGRDVMYLSGRFQGQRGRVMSVCIHGDELFLMTLPDAVPVQCVEQMTELDFSPRVDANGSNYGQG